MRSEPRGTASSSEDDELLWMTGKKVHHCTDCFWLFVLILAMVYECKIFVYSIQHQRVNVLLNRVDSSCGTNSSSGYMFFCRVDVDTVQFAHPNCTETCPTGNTTQSACLDPKLNRTQSITDYSTVPHTLFGRSYCLPDPDSLPQLYQEVKLHAWKLAMIRTGEHWVGQLFDAYPLILGILVVTVVLSYVYIYMVDQAGGRIVWLCMLVSVGAPAYKGYKLLAPIVLEDGGDENSSSEDLLIGSFMLLFAVTILGLFISRCNSLAVASGYVQAAAECVFEVSGLEMEPLMSLALDIILPVQMFVKFFLFWSTGFRRNDEGDLEIGEFDPDGPGWEAVVYYILMYYWLDGFCKALSRYVLSYATMLWYLTPINANGQKEILQNCPICEAYTNAFTYHLGSFAMGSLLSVLKGALCWPLAVLDNQPKDGYVATVCGCCLSWYQNHMEIIGLDAYMDMCVSSSEYMEAGRRVVEVKRFAVNTSKRLDRAQLLFKVSGLSMVTAITDFVAYFLCAKVKVGFNYEWRSVVLWTTICSFAISMHFMRFFDAIGDALLYFYDKEQEERDGDDDEDDILGFAAGFLWNQEPEKQSHVPRQLQSLVEQHGGQ